LADIIEAAKMAALQVMDATKPAGVYFGVVVSVAPLKINVEQKMTLESAQLILARNVTDYVVEMSVNHVTQAENEHVHEVIDTYTGGGSSLPTTHFHVYSGRKQFTVHNGLMNGDRVLLLRVQGGQKYVVWDRVT
jgi:hypothetical protein